MTYRMIGTDVLTQRSVSVLSLGAEELLGRWRRSRGVCDADGLVIATKVEPVSSFDGVVVSAAAGGHAGAAVALRVG